MHGAGSVSKKGQGTLSAKQAHASLPGEKDLYGRGAACFGVFGVSLRWKRGVCEIDDLLA